MFFPNFDDVQIDNYDLIGGYYTLGFLHAHRPDCLFITYDQWKNYENYDWLQKIIEEHLNKKIICLMPWDESILGRNNSQLSNVLNQYINEKVFFITQLSTENQHIYQFQNNIKCKIIELPWWLLNDTLTYYSVKRRLPLTTIQKPTDYYYLCMIGNPFSQHKTWLIEKLIEKKLSSIGLITVIDYSKYPKYFPAHVQINPKPPYQNTDNRWPKMAAQTKVKDIWISKNVENFLHIEQTYDIPLVINPETSPGIFMATEKSLWPCLLGKLYLIYGGPGCMQWIQKFHDVDQTKFANVSFDSIIGNYSDDDYKLRLDTMIESNIKLIKNSKTIFSDLKTELESARWSFGKRLYDFFIKQLNQIC